MDFHFTYKDRFIPVKDQINDNFTLVKTFTHYLLLK